MSSSSTDASASSRPRRSSAPRLRLAEEQAAEALSLLEQRDVTAALRLSLLNSWESDDEKDFESKYEDEAESEEDEKEERKRTSSMEVEEEWSEMIREVQIALPRSRRLHHRPASSTSTPMQLLQLFLAEDLMDDFAKHTNAAIDGRCAATNASELYAFIGAHIFMGIHRLARTEMYWKADIKCSLLTSVFSQHRFKDLQRFFRVREICTAIPSSCLRIGHQSF